ncbi:helix-turn-helix domain-containing protein [Patescibacteria group bacterium]
MTQKNKGKYFCPLPPRLFAQRMVEVEDLIRKCHSGLVVGCPGSGRSAYLRFSLAHRWQDLPTKQIYINFQDQDFKGLEQLIGYLLLQLKNDQASGAGFFAGDQYRLGVKLDRALVDWAQKGEKVSFIFDKIESLLPSLVEPVIRLSHRLWQVRRNPPVWTAGMIFIIPPSFLGKIDQLGQFASFLFDLKIFLPLLTKEEMLFLIRREAAFYNLKLKPDHLEVAWGVCGGMGNRVRQIVFLLARFKDKSAIEVRNALLVEEALVSGVREILVSLGKPLLEVLKRKQPKQADLEKLVKLGVVDGNGKMFGQLAQLELESLKKGKGNQGDFKNTGPLSDRENQLWEVFLRNQGEVVDHEKIAGVLWGSDWENSYSDWAISRAVNRFRKKIIDANGRCPILTVRKKGYRLVKRRSR